MTVRKNEVSHKSLSLFRIDQVCVVRLTQWHYHTWQYTYIRKNIAKPRSRSRPGDEPPSKRRDGISPLMVPYIHSICRDAKENSREFAIKRRALRRAIIYDSFSPDAKRKNRKSRHYRSTLSLGAQICRLSVIHTYRPFPSRQLHMNGIYMVRRVCGRRSRIHGLVSVAFEARDLSYVKVYCALMPCIRFLTYDPFEERSYSIF